MSGFAWFMAARPCPRPMRRILPLALVLAITLPVAGCLGGVTAAGIPNDALTVNSSRWTLEDESESSLLGGAVALYQRQYAPANAAASVFGGILIVSASDLPLLPEDRALPYAIEKAEEGEGMTLEEAGSVNLRLTNVDNLDVKGTLYNVKGKDVPAQGLLIDFYCPDAYVVGLAYGAKDGGVLGGASPFEQAKTLLSRIACSV